MKKRLRAVAARFLMMLASSFFTLLFLEIVVRLFSPQQLIVLRPDVFMSVEGLGFRHQPNVNTIINTGERDVLLITDENGYRIRPGKLTEATYRILALGDSYLAALQVNYEQTLIARLEDQLSNATGETVLIVNTGVGGYNPNHYRLVAQAELPRADYDLVLVFVYMANDVVERSVDHFSPSEAVRRHTLRAPRALSGPEIIDSILYPINDFLEERSHLYILVKSRSSALLARLGLTAYYFPDVFLVSSASLPEWDVTADILADIATVAGGYGVPVLYVLLPATYQVNEAEFEWYTAAFGINPSTVDLDQPTRLLQAGLEGRGLAVLDTTEALRDAHRQGIDDLYGRTDRHFGPAGHQVVADYLLPQILEHLRGDVS